MTDQTQTPEMRAAQAEQHKSVLESMLRETKVIATGLTERCAQLAAERDIQANDANQLRQLIQNQNEMLKSKDEKIIKLTNDLTESLNSQPVLIAPAPRKSASPN